MLITKKIVILAEYLDYTNVFLKDLVIELFKYSDINKHVIDLELGKQLLYEPIYSLKPVEFKTFKIYIKPI